MSTDYSSLLPIATLEKLAKEWLLEDTPTFDYGGYCFNTPSTTATLYQKTSGIVAGTPFFDVVFKLLNCVVAWEVKEGDYIQVDKKGRVAVATVVGNAKDILLGERVGLNMIARASGIATRARNLVELKKKHDWHGIIAGTRKTTPGFRIVEKYAMLVGGADTHRLNLSSMIMLKDNHVVAAGSITAAVEKAKSVGGFSVKIEVECKTMDEAREAIKAGADIVMLDNFKGKQFTEASAILKKETPKGYLIEGSGGLTLENCSDYFSPDVDILSFGSITQSVSHIDFSLKL